MSLLFPSTRRRRAMSFVEILMAIAVLSLGIIPLLVVMRGQTRQAQISLRQIQGNNHAANLLEALRSLGYQGLKVMPSAMVQPRGGEGRWEKFAGQDLELEIEDDNLGDQGVFEDWRDRFFSEPSVVPPLESLFTRYFYLYRQDGQPYVTVIVRVEWPARGRTATGRNTVVNRHVELRSLVADPYRGGSG